MSIEILDLDQIDPTLVTQELAALRSRLQEQYPTLHLQRGVYHDTVLYLHALLNAELRTNLQRYLASRSLRQISADPTLADEEEVDQVLSNWGVLRQAGVKASGEVTVVLSANTSVTLSGGTVFEAGGLRYLTPHVYSAKPEAGLVDHDTDRLISPTAEGNYAFTVTVVAESVGAEYSLAKDTVLAPLNPPLHFVTAYAASDFAGGLDAETNAELLQRQQEGVAAKAVSNRITMKAFLQDAFADYRIVHSSILGMGDAEMLRDQHSLIPVSFGGCMDWYVRSQERPQRTVLSKAAVLLGSTAEGYGLWQMAVLKDDAPGFYEIRDLRLLGAENVSGGFAITADLRDVDLTGEGLLPDIDNAAEGAYSRYQTATIRFVDTVTPIGGLAAGSQQTYQCEAVGLPLIAEIQDLVGSRNYCSYGADLLVKAPVPCFLTLNFTIHRPSDEDAPDLDAIRTALAATVNRVGFTGRLYASQLFDVIHRYLSGSSSVSRLDMLGRIRRPDGQTVYLRSDEVLQVPDSPEAMTTTNTVQFFLDPADVQVSVATTIPIPV